MKTVLILIFMIIGHYGQGQDKYFLKNQPNPIIPSSLKYKSPFLGKPYLHDGEKRIYLNELDSFQLFEMNYSIKMFRRSRKSRAVRSITKGAISLYDISRPPRNERIASITKLDIYYYPALEIRDTLYHYRLSRLKKELQHHNASMHALKPVRRANTISGVGNLLATLTIVAAGISDQDSPFSSRLWISALGLSLFTTTYDLLVTPKYLESLKKAIELYNKENTLAE